MPKMSPYDELADELTKRLHDPDAYAERKVQGKKNEPLKLQQVRALMTYFEDVQYKERDGQIVVVMRSAFRDKNENDE